MSPRPIPPRSTSGAIPASNRRPRALGHSRPCSGLPDEAGDLRRDQVRPFTIAVDLLSQAEHGPDSPCVLITTSHDVGATVLSHIKELLPGLATPAVAEPAWEKHGQVHVVDSLVDAFRLADLFASEHVQILTANPREALEEMHNYGALFLGEGTCVAYGDKVIGTNHVLPPLGAARYTGGLWVGKFLKTVTYQEVRNPDSSAMLGEACGRLSRLERFEGHARSGDVRAAKYGAASLGWAPRAVQNQGRTRARLLDQAG